MNKSILATLTASLIVAQPLFATGTFTIAKYTFNDANAVSTATIVEGPHTVVEHSAHRFGRFSQDYVSDPLSRTNEFNQFDRSKSLGRLLGGINSSKKGSDYARYVVFPDANTKPTANVDRITIEMTWGADKGLKNAAGPDLVVYESGAPQPYEVAVRKVGSATFTPYRFQFHNKEDSLHEANATAFDLSDFGLAEGDAIAAIRIRNAFNVDAKVGPDKVDSDKGEGNIVYPGDANYSTGFPMKRKVGGSPWPTDMLNADILYVVGLHDIEEVKGDVAPAKAAAVAPADSEKKAEATTDSASASAQK